MTKRKSGWTAERRRRQSELMRELQPWKKSTGPKTKGGKAKSRLNAVKHGERARALLLLKRAARNHKKYVNMIQKMIDFALDADVCRRVQRLRSNELLKTPEK